MINGWRIVWTREEERGVERSSEGQRGRERERERYRDVSKRVQTMKTTLTSLMVLDFTIPK